METMDSILHAPMRKISCIMNFVGLRCLLLVLVLSITELNATAKKKIYFGAFYYDGWGGSNKKNSDISDAPIALSSKLAKDYSDRKPIWGWRDDSLSIMERQINLASENGVDFFAFDWHWQDNRQTINPLGIRKRAENNGIYLFMKAKNKKR